ncbi:hypothetical protein [Streptomyces sp. NBC_00258]|uniref:hypothetical protein n=1 Tax=Streptomyces sp. NBC_00258 TaxID=2903642 RepID=UPI002E2C087F|nr:hypothetical protein [Streptomyces sp. NBC_00258]
MSAARVEELAGVVVDRVAVHDEACVLVSVPYGLALDVARAVYDEVLHPRDRHPPERAGAVVTGGAHSDVRHPVS